MKIGNFTVGTRSFSNRLRTFVFLVLGLGSVLIAGERTNYFTGSYPVPTQEQLVMDGPFIMERVKRPHQIGVTLRKPHAESGIFVEEDFFDIGIDLNKVVEKAGPNPVVYAWLFPDSTQMPVWKIRVNEFEVMSYEQRKRFQQIQINTGWRSLKLGSVFLLLGALSLLRIDMNKKKLQ